MALPSERLDGRHALITGAGRGLGRACALALAQAGAAVTLVARSEEELAEIAAEIVAAGGSARVAAADVTDAAALERASRRPTPPSRWGSSSPRRGSTAPGRPRATTSATGTC